jgi:1-deoxy-D-xylulose-5-phosphate synthase
VLDIALCLAIPNMTIFAPSSAQEVPEMLSTAMSMSTPTALRFPKTLPQPFDKKIGEGLRARRVARGDGSLCVLAVGKMAPSSFAALQLLGETSRRITLYDVRVLPPDATMIDDALEHDRIITVEDGTRHGGGGALMVAAARTRSQELGRPLPTTRILGVPRAYLEHHHPDALLAEIGLDPEGLAGAFERILNDQPEFPRVLPEAPRPKFL